MSTEPPSSKESFRPQPSLTPTVREGAKLSQEERETRWELQLARLQTQIFSLEERFNELQQLEVARKQRALWLRIVLLLVLLGLFFFLQLKKGAS